MPTASTIAIDGPVASGKTTIGRMLAHRLGYRFLDTGVMYRAVTYLGLRAGVAPDDEEGLTAVAREVNLDLGESGDGSVTADGEPLLAELRTAEVDQAVSHVSKVQGVRDALVEQQQRIAQGGSMVMVGRDIGTVVLPDADLKIYLTATPRERARRRHLELRRKAVGQSPVPSYQQIFDDLASRDELDSNRSNSPLTAADDSIRLITDGMPVTEVLDRIMVLLRRQRGPAV